MLGTVLGKGKEKKIHCVCAQGIHTPTAEIIINCFFMMTLKLLNTKASEHILS
jgi:hypothetical protein